MRAIGLVFFILFFAAAPPSGLVQKLPAGASVDWTAGTIAASGGAAADLRAANTEVARVGAERAASERARAALEKAVRALPLAGGGTVGGKADADKAAAARVEAVLARARAADISYATDGGARVLLAAPLEAVRAALDPPEPPAADPAAPTGIVVDGRKVAGLRPVLGLRLAAGKGGKPAAFPTVWHDDAERGQRDPRAGGRVQTVLATGFDTGKGILTIDAQASILESAAAAGALVVVVVSEGAKK